MMAAPHMQPARALVIGAFLTVATAALISAQGFGRSWGACRTNWDPDGYFVSPFFAGNPKYDGRVTFARINIGARTSVVAKDPGGRMTTRARNRISRASFATSAP